MNSKILLLSIAVISVGLFAMPSTLSLFAGQHTFDKAGNTTICKKCHVDVYDELDQSSFHTSLFNVGGSGDCRGCHTADTVNSSTIPIGNQTGKYLGTNVSVGLDTATGFFNASNGTRILIGNVHAAVTIECVWCHSGVNLTNDAHSVLASNATTVNLKGSNAACMGCHTKTLVNMTWIRRTGYNLTYNFNNSNFTNFEASSATNTTYSLNQ